MKNFVILIFAILFLASPVISQKNKISSSKQKKIVKSKLDIKAVSKWLTEAFKKNPIIKKKQYELKKYFVKVNHPSDFETVVLSQDNLRFVSKKTFEHDIPASISFRCNMSSDYIEPEFNLAELKRFNRILMFAYGDYKEMYSETLVIKGNPAMRTLWTSKYYFAPKDSKDKDKKKESVLMVNSMINVYFMNFRYQFLFEVPAKQYYKYRNYFRKFVNSFSIRNIKKENKKILEKGFKYLAEKKFKKSYKEFEYISHKLPYFYPALEGMYYSYLGAKKDKKALDIINKGQKLFSDIDNFYLKEFDYYNAKKNEEKINEVFDKSFSNKVQSSIIYTEAAYYLAKKSQVSDKLIKALLNLANNKDPLNSIAWMNTAKYFILKGKFHVAEAFLKQVLRLNPTDKALWLYLADIYQKQPGLHQKAILALRKLAMMYSEDLDVLTSLANTLVKYNQVKESVQVFNKIFSIDPDYIPALTTVGLNMYQMGQYKKALSCFEKIVEQKPKDFYALNYLGMCNFFTGKIEKAKSIFEKMKMMKPNVDASYMGLGLVFAHLGKYDESKKNFDRALKINPENKYARKMRSQVIRQKHLEK